jgi:hypothetical protein
MLLSQESGRAPSHGWYKVNWDAAIEKQTDRLRLKVKCSVQLKSFNENESYKFYQNKK